MSSREQNMGSELRGIQSVVLLVCLVLVSLPMAYADRGGLPLVATVQIYEPGQKAIVAWNGYEEILILSTDVRADEETMVLEILPLPSKPEIELASIQSFQKIQEMIWEEGMSRFHYQTLAEARGSSVEIIFHEEIGAHNITVVEADDAIGLVTWTNDFLLQSGVNQNITLGRFQAVVQDYMERGFKYYALDLVTLQLDARSIDPLLYRFNSSTLYYPLLITSPVGGGGRITLFLLTKDRLENFGVLVYPDFSPAFYQISPGFLQMIELPLSAGELSTVDLRLRELLPSGAWLTVRTYQGDLGSLTKDVMLTAEDFSKVENSSPRYIITLPTETAVLLMAAGAALALAGAGFALLSYRFFRKK